MRFFLLAFKIFGFLRSSFVILKIIASLTFIVFSALSSSSWLAICENPGISFIIPPREPIFLICWNWNSISSIVNCPLIMRCADFAPSSISIFSCACSTSETISPIPKIRSAMRSGWNTSKSSIFSPRPTNLTGT